MTSRVDTHLPRNSHAPRGASIAAVGVRFTNADTKDLTALVRSGAG